MRVTIRLDVAGFARQLAGLERQVRFAAAQALTKSAVGIRAEMPSVLEQQLDRPTAFTKTGMFVTKATRENLQAVVGFKDVQASYLRWQVDGGQRPPKRKAQRLPSDIDLDAFGNLPRGTIKRLLAAARSGRRLTAGRARRLGLAADNSIFYGVPKGHPGALPGLYARRNAGGQRKLQTLIVFPSLAAKYSPRFDFEGRARLIFRRDLPELFTAAVRNALATARPGSS